MARSSKFVSSEASKAILAGATPEQVVKRFGYTLKGARRLRSRLLQGTPAAPSSVSPPAPSSPPPSSAHSTAGADRRTLEPDFAAAAAASGTATPPAGGQATNGSAPPPPPPPQITPEAVIDMAEMCLGMAVAAACARYRVPATLPEVQSAAKLAPSERRMLSYVAPSIARQLPTLAAMLDKYAIYVGGAMLCFFSWQHVTAIRALAVRMQARTEPARPPEAGAGPSVN